MKNDGISKKTYKSQYYEYSSDLEKTSLSNKRAFGIRLRGLADVEALTELTIGF